MAAGALTRCALQRYTLIDGRCKGFLTSLHRKNAPLGCFSDTMLSFMGMLVVRLQEARVLSYTAPAVLKHEESNHPQQQNQELFFTNCGCQYTPAWHVEEVAYFPQRASLRRRVSLELRKGTNTRPFLLRLPSALMQLASASRDLRIHR